MTLVISSTTTLYTQNCDLRHIVNVLNREGRQFYHDVGEISDLSQSEAPNLVMWRVMVMQPRPRLLGDEVVVGPNLMFRKMDPWNVIRNILQDKTDKNQL